MKITRLVVVMVGGIVMGRCRTLLCAALVAALTVGIWSGESAASAAPTAGPVVGNLSVHGGVWWGGRQVVVLGRNFVDVRNVLFDDRRSWGFTVVSPTRITVTVPSHADGIADVRVVTDTGTSPRRRPADTYDYTAARMGTPIFGGLSARQERRIGARKMRSHHGVHVAPSRHRWTPAMGLTAVHRARSWIGMPYSWAGGNASGPTHGVCARNGGDNDCRVTGFDCSGLTLYSWAPYVGLVHYAQTQKYEAGRFHPTIGELVPGDLVYFSAYVPNGIGHTAIYAGHGMVIQAEQSGTLVMRSKLSDVIAASGTYRGATRPATSGVQGRAPVVTSASPTVAAAGGDVVLTGRRLDQVQSVAFGSTHVYSFVHQSATRLVVRAPAHAVGAGDVLASTAWGTSRPRTVTYVGSGGSSRPASGDRGPQHLSATRVSRTGRHVDNRVRASGQVR